MAYDANDPKQVEKAKKQAEIDGALKLDEIRKVMQSAPGRRWMNELLERCHCFHTSFISGAPDASAFREGERNIGLQILADIQNAAPDLYLTMIQEAKGTGA